jgi:hypothetical protein
MRIAGMIKHDYKLIGIAGANDAWGDFRCENCGKTYRTASDYPYDDTICKASSANTRREL